MEDLHLQAAEHARHTTTLACKARGSRGVDFKSTVILDGFALLLVDVLVDHLSVMVPDVTAKYPLAHRCLPQYCLFRCGNSWSNTRELVPFSH